MWARIFEFNLAVWLAISPFVFRYGDDQTALWASSLVCAVLIAAVALLCFKPRLAKLHLLHIATGVWLIGFGAYALGAEPPPPAPFQNHVVTGLLLIMFAVLPSRSDQPPRAWREFYQRRK